MTLKIGFLGCGFIARYHAAMLQMAEEPNRIVSVYDDDPERGGSFGADHGAAVASDPAEVIDASDAVFVCTWTAAHLDGVRAVAATGTPLFCEKPLSTDLHGAEQVVAAVEHAGLLNQVGLVLRSAPALLAVRELLAAPGSGSVMNVVFRDDQYLPTQGIYASSWRGDRELAGSGALLEHSIHDVDLLEWLLGPAERVNAHQEHFHGLSGIEDSISAMFRFGSGATATLSSIWHDVLSRPSQRRIEIFCERAVITVEGEIFGPVRYLCDDEELELVNDGLLAWLAAHDVDVVSAEQDFLVAVRRSMQGADAQRLRPDVRDALRAHEVVDALYRSAERGGATIEVPTPRVT